MERLGVLVTEGLKYGNIQRLVEKRCVGPNKSWTRAVREDVVGSADEEEGERDGCTISLKKRTADRDSSRRKRGKAGVWRTGLDYVLGQNQAGRKLLPCICEGDEQILTQDHRFRRACSQIPHHPTHLSPS